MQDIPSSSPKIVMIGETCPCCFEFVFTEEIDETLRLPARSNAFDVVYLAWKIIRAKRSV
jgi:hypothetical protein